MPMRAGLQESAPTVMPTADDFQPRRDGFFEHRGVWAEVTKGTVLKLTENRTDRWEVIDIAMATPVEYGYTLWMRVRDQVSGVENTVRPRNKTWPVTILTQDRADTKTAPLTPPSDADAIMLLIEQLGAQTLAQRDNVTGEIVCPDYIERSHIPGHGDRQIDRGLIEHMRIAHKMSVDDDTSTAALVTMHGQAHNPKWPNVGKGGWPHRHTPEDLTLL